ncbi:Protein of unknown function DUF1963 like protein [Aduncisulcus paluster]|uniref:DUF1963 domain-containing protein n=1 Tax=Aduncisulcus paluster TaxID=2918883 RepID=A0ABQ5K9L3_9EUKA|nr:Protein of unknown function DUF1963 like protein [Aduncisulcus paluster]
MPVVPEYPNGLTLPILQELLAEADPPFSASIYPSDATLTSFYQALKSLEKIKYTTSCEAVAEIDDVDTLCSKYGGKKPYVSEQHPYPICPHDNLPLVFFFQLCVNDIPEEIRPASLLSGSILQLFKCRALDGSCSAVTYAGGLEDPEYFCRIVNPLVETASTAYPLVPDPIETLSCKKVTGYIPRLCFPNYVEFSQHFPEFSDEVWLDLVFDSLHDKFEFDGDGIGGYPQWVQSPDYRSCPICGATCEFVYQIEGEDLFQFMFGDCGNCQILVCPEHGDQSIQMVWASG